MLFGKFCIDYSSGQFDTSKHCTEPENTKTIVRFQIISFGVLFSCFPINSGLFLAAADSVLSAAFLSNDGDDSA